MVEEDFMDMDWVYVNEDLNVFDWVVCPSRFGKDIQCKSELCSVIKANVLDSRDSVFVELMIQ